MFKKERNDLSRFWELFNPNTNNLQLWLASSAFSFFAFTSLKRGAGMNLQELTALGFFIFGYFCIAVIIYLFISWIFGFHITKKHKR